MRRTPGREVSDLQDETGVFHAEESDNAILSIVTNRYDHE
jgi:hypothetical protein